jgi:hypothetical protein
MNGKLYNNIGICSLSIAFTLQHVEHLSLPQTLLIMPIIAHEDLLKYMTSKKSGFINIEQLIVSKPECFLNFNARFYDGLMVSLNSIQFLYEMNFIKFEGGCVISKERIDFDSSMGVRAKNIFNASNRIANVVSSNASNLYTNLRIEL